MGEGYLLVSCWKLGKIFSSLLSVAGRKGGGYIVGRSLERKNRVKTKTRGLGMGIYLREGGYLLVSWGRQSATRAITAETRDNRRKVPGVLERSPKQGESKKFREKSKI